jgi:8-oxo-dGTP pyrophosphatase MutT (NUDIX family)
MTEPVFVPKEGQIDYTNIKEAPVINCVVFHGEKMLLIKRAAGLRFYPNYWNGISGFLDDEKSLEEKVAEELKEEAGFNKENILSIEPKGTLTQEAPEYDKVWIVHPVRVEVNTGAVTLDWEGAEYKWVTPEEAKDLNLLPGFDETLLRIYEQ